MRAILLSQLTVFTFAAAAQAGLVHTVVGGGSSYGDGGPATAARLTTPQGLAFDAAGNLYIADDTAFVVRRVDAATGIITTVAGNGTFGDQGDGGPATLANLANPLGIAVDLHGDLYIADQLNLRIRKVDLGTGSGTITSFAGDGSFGIGGDQGPATNASMAFPEGVAVDAIGDVYVADSQNFKVRRVTRSTGIINTIAGGDGSGVSGGDGGPALDAGFSTARRIAIDQAGNYYVVDFIDVNGGVIRRVDAATTIIQTVAGGGTGTGESGPALDADLGEVRDVAVDAAGNLYVAGRFRVWKVGPAGNISVLAGTGINGFGGDGGPAEAATFGEIYGVAVDSDGNVYISDQGNARIRKVDADVPIPVPAMGVTARLLSLALLAGLAVRSVPRGRNKVGCSINSLG